MSQRNATDKYHKKTRFCLWNVFRHICRRSILFLVWCKSIHFSRGYSQKRFLHFRSRWLWTLTFCPQIRSPGYPCPRSCLHQIWSFYRKRRRTNGRTKCHDYFMRPLREGRVINKLKNAITVTALSWFFMRACLWDETTPPTAANQTAATKQAPM